MAAFNDNTGSRLLGLDVGRRKIGVAVSDPAATVALPLKVISRTSLTQDKAAVAALMDKYRVKVLVVGCPLGLDGEPGRQAAEVEEFIAAVLSGLPAEVRRWDERLTTKAAERDLISLGVSRRRRRSLIDAAAATLILQSYLDNKNK